MSEKIALRHSKEFTITHQILMHGGVSDPTMIGPREYLFIKKGPRVLAVHHDPERGLIAEPVTFVEERLIWFTETSFCLFLIGFPRLPDQAAEWAQTLIQNAHDVNALKFIVKSLNGEPAKTWPCSE